MPESCEQLLEPAQQESLRPVMLQSAPAFFRHRLTSLSPSKEKPSNQAAVFRSCWPRPCILMAGVDGQQMSSLGRREICHARIRAALPILQRLDDGKRRCLVP